MLDFLTNSVSVNGFIPLEKLADEYRLLSRRYACRMVPIAYAEGGNYVCLGMGSRGQGVYFLDHEFEGDNAFTWLTRSIPEFLAALRPFEKPSLSPGQVKRVWISPELAKKLKKQDT